MVSPSNLPSGKKLKEIVLESLLRRDLKEEIKLLRANKLYNDIISVTIEGKGEIVIYQAQDGQASIDVRLENDTVWLRLEQLLSYLTGTVPSLLDILIIY